MYVFWHVVCCLVAGFFAAWAVSLNELRFGDKAYSSRWIWLLVIVLLTIAFGVATLNV